MKLRTPPSVPAILRGLALVAFAVTAALAADPTSIVDDEKGLAVRNSVDIPFTLTDVPANPELRLKFKVDSKGSCPITYKPTVVSINGQRVGAIDFRTHWWKDEPKLKVPSGVLKTGENVVQITMGSCQYGVDAMRLNKLTLVQ
jgi:hypothetical protein